MTQVDIDAFVRHRALEGFGPDGQEALSAARVAIVGVGGLGCPVALYLATSGVGHLTLVDSDHVSVTNLHRQVLFGPADVGQLKVDAAARALSRVAPQTTVTTLASRLGDDAAEVLAGHDLILDCTDTWASRFSVADAAERLGVRLVWGAVSGWFGQVTVFGPGRRLRDLFPEHSVSQWDVCEGGGVLGPLCGQVGTAMATQAVVMLAGAGSGLEGKLAIIDAREGVWRDVPVAAASA